VLTHTIRVFNIGEFSEPSATTNQAPIPFVLNTITGQYYPVYVII